MTLRAGLTLLGVALIFGLGFHFGGLEAARDLSDYKAKAEKALADSAKAEAAASEHARAVERASQEKADRLAAAYEEAKRNEKASTDRLIGDLRRGTVQLHSRWQACIATDKLSEATRAPGESDDAARGQQDSAGRIIGATDRDKAKIEALQEYAREVSR